MARGTIHKEQEQQYNTARRAASSALAAKPKMTTDDLVKESERKKARDLELVSGLFINYESPGGRLEFRYQPPYKGVPFDAWSFQDGERYTIPRMIARHINTGCYYKKYKNVTRPDGTRDEMINAFHNGRLDAKNMQYAQKQHRFAFNPLDYMMDDDLDIMPAKPIIEASMSI